ncbi:RNA-binding protein [Asticcacaulis sp. BYS171W]|uniref:RNA-binding protein n=1 Tax=Asticcacaulis aquaticus TaxID=2984212 RepID=A0ABT5HSP5_9CAUL|nr:RNA-binding protein [Asticcacaulis aquaticus]
MTPTPNNETLVDLTEDSPEAETPQDATLPVETTRRDIASHTAFARDGLIRFVVSPDGFAVPDLKENLPGRGLWLKADADSLALAIKKNLFSRAAKRQVKAPDGLSDMVPNLIRKRVLDQLGLARREGNLLTGFEKVAAALKLGRSQPHAAGRAAWLIEAADGAEDGRNKLLSVAFSQTPPVNICGIFTNDELSLALGLENVIHAAIVEGRRSQAFSKEITRLSGFQPLFPAKWRERPFN